MTMSHYHQVQRNYKDVLDPCSSSSWIHSSLFCQEDPKIPYGTHPDPCSVNRFRVELFGPGSQGPVLAQHSYGQSEEFTSGPVTQSDVRDAQTPFLGTVEREAPFLFHLTWTWRNRSLMLWKITLWGIKLKPIQWKADREVERNWVLRYIIWTPRLSSPWSQLIVPPFSLSQYEQNISFCH